MSPAPRKADNYWTASTDAALKKEPPIIGWRRKPNGVWVHTYVNDPHAESPHNGEKAACKRGHKYTEENTIITRDGRQCRTCKNAMRKPLTPEQKQRALNLNRQRRRRLREEAAGTSLMTAVRTEI